MAPRKTTTTKAPVTDKPLAPNLTIDALMAETQAPEPFRFAIGNSKIVTFPDLYDVPVEEAEEFLEQLNNLGSNDMEFLGNWLSEEDFELYKSAGLKLRQHARLMNMVLDYYEASMGKRPEGSASAS